MRVNPRSLALFALILAALAVLVGLGTWQVQRHLWKDGVVDERHARTDGEPLDSATASTLTAPEIDFHRVALAGDWDWSHTMALANRARETSKGEELIVPLVLADGRAVLVNRGWYPDGARDAAITALQDRPQGRAEGLARDPDNTESRQIPNGSWTRLAPVAMGATLPYPVVDWIVFEGTEVVGTPRPGSDLPLQGWQRFTNTTPHVQYAITWYGLAVALAVIAVVRLVVAPRRAARAARPVERAEG